MHKVELKNKTLSLLRARDAYCTKLRQISSKRSEERRGEEMGCRIYVGVTYLAPHVQREVFCVNVLRNLTLFDEQHSLLLLFAQQIFDEFPDR